jgi:hypothetical protein
MPNAQKGKPIRGEVASLFACKQPVEKMYSNRFSDPYLETRP